MSAEPDGARGTNWWSVGLWAAQIALALAFGASGVTKLFQPVETLAAAMEWVAHSPPALVRFIGFAELAGAVGMILPAATLILPWLTPLAALGFAVIEILAIGVHAALGETAETLAFNLVLLGLSAFVIWGRTQKVVTSSRS